jgi:hypothetical protein
VGGAALKLEVRADGFIYILHKASSHKAYTVFENGTAMGYDFAMNTTNDLLGPIFKWTLSGEGEYNYILKVTLLTAKNMLQDMPIGSQQMQ